MSDDGPFIQIDDDWKAQAQKDKQQHADQAKATKPAPGSSPASPASSSASPVGSAAPAGGSPGPRELPEANFDTLSNTLASQALMYMGAMPDAQGRAYVSPENARHHIDLLGVLQEKTKGNLSDEETRQLGATLHELRSAYISVSKMLRDQAMGKNEPANAR